MDDDVTYREPTVTATPEDLDLSWLVDNLRELRNRVSETSQAFDPLRPESFIECAGDLAARTRDVWAGFGEHCHPYRNATLKARDAVRGWPAKRERILTAIDEGLEEAGDTLRETFRSIIHQNGVAPLKWNSESSSNGMAEEQRIRGEIAELRVGVTGLENGTIPARSIKLAFWVGGVATVLYGLAEIMAGSDFFRQVGSFMSAVGTMTLLVVMLSVTAMGLGIAGKRWLYWYLASRAFNKNFPGSVASETGHRFELYPLEAKYPVICVCTFAGLFIGSWALVIWRTYLAETNDLLKGTAAVAWIVFAAVWVLALLEFFISPAYDEEYRERLEALEAELTELQRKNHPAAPGPFQLPPDAKEAVRCYKGAVKELKQLIANAVEEARKIRERYVQFRYKYADVLTDHVIPSYEKVLGDLISAVRGMCISAGVDPTSFSSTRVADDLVKDVCFVGDEETLKLVQNFAFDLQFPQVKVIADFEELYKDIQTQILTKQRKREMAIAQENLQVPHVQSK